MKKRIVIVGGGFAGARLSRSLAASPDFDITVVDQNNYNFFTPLIYQVGTGFLEPSSIAYPFRNLFKGKENTNFWLGKVEEIFPKEKKLQLSNGTLFFDYLVMATGSKTNFFGLEQVKKYAISMNTLEDALTMRNTILQRIEKACQTTDLEEKERLLTIVIAGGGPTGVEVSGMFAEMRNSILAKEYPELHPFKLKIYLISGGPSLLAPFSEKSQCYTLESLRKMGVEVHLNTRVLDFDGTTVKLNNETNIKSRNLIWATGVISLCFKGIPQKCYGRGNRMKVDEFNRIIGLTDVFAIGDTCIQETDKSYPNGHPQLGQVAIQQGKNLAKNLMKLHHENTWTPFVYNDKGIMAIIGKTKAVADLTKPHLHFKGFPAWFIWSIIHLFSLINRHDRIRTFYNWSLNYLSDNLDLRMIIRPEKKL